MKFKVMLDVFRDRPFFETRDLEIYFDVPTNQRSVMLSRWVDQGKIVQLRRGKYLLAEPYRRKQATQEFLANYLYRPSYISLQRALQFYGMIPEAVGLIQSVTTNDTRRWETDHGVFDYRSIKQERFWGYHQQSYTEYPDPQEPFLIARPEKALLDLFYFNKNEWTENRLREMRFQQLEKVNKLRLEEDTVHFDSPRISQAVDRLIYLHGEEMES